MRATERAASLNSTFNDAWHLTGSNTRCSSAGGPDIDALYSTSHAGGRLNSVEDIVRLVRTVRLKDYVEQWTSAGNIATAGRLSVLILLG